MDFTIYRAMSICRRFSKVSHRFEAKICGLYLLAIFTFSVFTLWHIALVLYSKRKSSITAPAPLTTKLISKQARLNATKSVLVLNMRAGRLRECSHVFQFFYYRSVGIREQSFCLLDFPGEGVLLFSKPWPVFRPKHVIFHTRFQTRPLKSIPVFRPGL